MNEKQKYQLKLLNRKYVKPEKFDEIIHNSELESVDIFVEEEFKTLLRKKALKSTFKLDKSKTEKIFSAYDLFLQNQEQTTNTNTHPDEVFITENYFESLGTIYEFILQGYNTPNRDDFNSYPVEFYDDMEESMEHIEIATKKPMHLSTVLKKRKKELKEQITSLCNQLQSYTFQENNTELILSSLYVQTQNRYCEYELIRRIIHQNSHKQDKLLKPSHLHSLVDTVGYKLQQTNIHNTTSQILKNARRDSHIFLN